MRLTQWTDYTLRVLMFCAACENRKEPVTITEIADAYNISRSHLTKVVFAMSGLGWLITTRGRGGGMRLARPAASFNLDDVVKATETDFYMVECFDAKTNRCGLTAHCMLKGALWEATQSYLSVLRRYTLADLVPHEPSLERKGSGQRPLIAMVPGIPMRVPNLATSSPRASKRLRPAHPKGKLPRA